jgi:hypothetical protein
MQMNPERNLLKTFDTAVKEGKIREFMIVGRYEDTNDYLIARSQMPSTSEINLAAQLQSAVNVRVAQENMVNNPTIPFPEE